MNNGLAKEWTEALFAGYPGRLPELETAMKNSSALKDKLAEAVFLAAEDSVKLSAGWTKEVIADLEQVTKSQPEPAELATTLAKFTTDAAGKSTQKMTALAEIMGRMQAETIRLFVEASKDNVTNGTSAEAAAPKAKKTPTAKAA